MRELLYTFLSTRPEFAKPKRCRKELIGPMRQHLRQHTGAELLEENIEKPERVKALIEERSVAQDALEEFCARCGRCEWGQLR